MLWGSRQESGDVCEQEHDEQIQKGCCIQHPVSVTCSIKSNPGNNRNGEPDKSSARSKRHQSIATQDAKSESTLTAPEDYGKKTGSANNQKGSCGELPYDR